MDAIITGAVALQQIRRSRCGRVVATPSSLAHVPYARDHASLAAWLDSSAVRGALDLVDQEPIPIRAQNARLRGHATTAKAHVTTASFAPQSFWELTFKCTSRGADPLQDNHLYIDGPELCVLSAAKELLGRVGKGVMSRTTAILKLTTLIMELCGTYSRDPEKPQVQAATYGVEPVATVEGIERSLRGSTGVKGIKLVREALRWARDGSRSAMESFTYVAFVCPPRFGGVSVGSVRLNEALELTARQLSVISHQTITPDFYIERYDAIVEYLGKGPHEGNDARNEDRRRWKDYSTLCVRSFPMTFDDLRTPRAFNAFCRRLVQGLDDRDRRRELHRLNKLFRDDKFLVAQTRLFAALLPPRTCYDVYLGEKTNAREALWGF